MGFQKEGGIYFCFANKERISGCIRLEQGGGGGADTLDEGEI